MQFWGVVCNPKGIVFCKFFETCEVHCANAWMWLVSLLTSKVTSALAVILQQSNDFLRNSSRNTAYNKDHRWRIVYQRKALEYSVRQVAENLGVSPATVHRIEDRTSTVSK